MVIWMLEQYLPFVGLIIFGNIENLVLSSQGVVAGVNPIKLGIASILCVSMWLIIGTFGTQLLIDYVSFIEFIGGLAILILGAQAMITSISRKPNFSSSRSCSFCQSFGFGHIKFNCRCLLAVNRYFRNKDCNEICQIH